MLIWDTTPFFFWSISVLESSKLYLQPRQDPMSLSVTPFSQYSPKPWLIPAKGFLDASKDQRSWQVNLHFHFQVLTFLGPHKPPFTFWKGPKNPPQETWRPRKVTHRSDSWPFPAMVPKVLSFVSQCPHISSSCTFPGVDYQTSHLLPIRDPSATI